MARTGILGNEKARERREIERWLFSCSEYADDKKGLSQRHAVIVLHSTVEDLLFPTALRGTADRGSKTMLKFPQDTGPVDRR